EISFGNRDLEPPIGFKTRCFGNHRRKGINNLLTDLLRACRVTFQVVNKCGVDCGVTLVVADPEFITTTVVVERKLEIAVLRKSLPPVFVDRTGDAERLLIRRGMQIVAVGQYLDCTIESNFFLKVRILVRTEGMLLPELCSELRIFIH